MTIETQAPMPHNVRSGTYGKMGMGVRKVFAAAVAATALTVSGSAGVTHAVQASPAATTPAAARALLNAINRDRAVHHAPPLALDPRESRCSLQHSKHMATIGSLSHDQFPADICVPHTAAGENVGVASGSDITALLQIHRMMMAEGPCPDYGCPDTEFVAHGHYANLVDAHFKRIGIGVTISNGTVWLTEDFAG